MTPGRRNFARLVAYDTGQVTRVWSICSQPFTIGPGLECGLVIPDTSSRKLPSEFCRIMRGKARDGASMATYIVSTSGISIQINGAQITDGKHPVSFEALRLDSVHARFNTMQLLGSGGFGTVYSVQDVDTGKAHAMKVMSKARCLPGPSGKDPIMNEVEILRAANHPNIVKFQRVFHEPRHLYLIMELVPKGSLQDLIKARKRLNIKPGNILVKSEKPLMVKVSDFGLAKIVAGGTDLRSECGTPAFMAPEISGVPGYTYDNKVDTWAMGGTLFMMLSGTWPFNVDHDMRPIFRVRWDKLPEETSREAIDLICRMLTVNPRHRPLCTELPSHLWFRTPTIKDELDVPDQEQPQDQHHPLIPGHVQEISVSGGMYRGASAVLAVLNWTRDWICLGSSYWTRSKDTSQAWSTCTRSYRDPSCEGMKEGSAVQSQVSVRYCTGTDAKLTQAEVAHELTGNVKGSGSEAKELAFMSHYNSPPRFSSVLTVLDAQQCDRIRGPFMTSPGHLAGIESASENTCHTHNPAGGVYLRPYLQPGDRRSENGDLSGPVWTGLGQSGPIGTSRDQSGPVGISRDQSGQSAGQSGLSVSSRISQSAYLVSHGSSELGRLGHNATTSAMFCPHSRRQEGHHSRGISRASGGLYPSFMRLTFSDRVALLETSLKAFTLHIGY
ncbi:kinase-like domain-containing protein [Earliella scabrosa]|nr:kinase-like domain-containing protein [Earliella scabrosa]